jgi:hypothetical protein
VLSIRTLVGGQSVVPGTVLVSLFCRSLPEQAPLYTLPNVNMITFGGNHAFAGSTLEYNGNATTPVNMLQGVFMPSSAPGMHFFRLAWHKSTRGPTTIGVMWDWLDYFTLTGESGTIDLDFNMYRDGSNYLYIIDVSSGVPGEVPLGTSMLTFYSRGFVQPDTTPVNCIDMANSLGTIVFGGNITAPGNLFSANGNVTSPAYSQENVVGTVIPIGVNSRTCYLSYATQFGDASTNLELLQNGNSVWQFNLQQNKGALYLDPLIFNQGNTLQLKFIGGTPPGQSVVSIFMSEV